MALRDILAAEGFPTRKEANALERLAGWTAGVFDQSDYQARITGPVLAACTEALRNLEQMAAENQKHLKIYQMAGMEYNQETRAALESQAFIRKYGGAIQDLQETFRKLGAR